MYKIVCNCVRTKLKFCHSNENNSTLSLQWSTISDINVVYHLGLQMFTSISCNTVYRHLKIYRLSVRSILKKRRRLYVHYRSHACIY